MTEERILGRVRALLAKAESTEFSEEAEAFMGKVQALMSRHSIDQAMVAGAGRGAAPELVTLTIEDPYAARKAGLLAAVGAANRCEVVWSAQLSQATVVGYRTDQAAVEALFTSLLLQGAQSLAGLGTQTDRSGRSRTRSFRSAFWAGYAWRLGARLRESDERATRSAAERHGSALVPVLASRRDEVRAAVLREFPQLRSSRATISNAAGYHAGEAAARLASLAPRYQVGS